MSNDSQPPLTWLLVSGAPRSGTTIVRRLLNDHPAIVLTMEYGLTRWVRQLSAIVSSPFVARRWWLDYGASDADGALHQSADFYARRQTVVGEDRSLARPGPEHFEPIARAVFRALAPGKDAHVVGDKMPITGSWEDVEYLVSKLATLRFVFVLRNPRGVVNSSLLRRERTRRGLDDWHIKTVEDACLEWAAAWRQMRAVSRLHPERTYFLKYEDLCSEPHATYRALLAFLGLDAPAARTPMIPLPETISFLSEVEEKTVAHWLGAVISDWAQLDPAALLAKYAAFPAPYRLGTLCAFSDRDTGKYLASGFYPAEAWGCWTDGERALLVLRPEPQISGQQILLELWLAYAFVRPGEFCTFTVRINGLAPTPCSVAAGRTYLSLVAPAEPRQGLEIEICVERPKLPHENPSNDGRRLGLGLEAFRLSLASPERPRGALPLSHEVPLD